MGEDGSCLRSLRALADGGFSPRSQPQIAIASEPERAHSLTIHPQDTQHWDLTIAEEHKVAENKKMKTITPIVNASPQPRSPEGPRMPKKLTMNRTNNTVAGRPTLGPADRRRRRRRRRREKTTENATGVEAHRTSERERCGRKKKKALTARERTTPPRSPEGPRMLKNSTSSSLSRSQSLITPEKMKRKKKKSKSRSPGAVALRVSHHEADPTRPRRRNNDAHTR